MDLGGLNVNFSGISSWFMNTGTSIGYILIVIFLILLTSGIFYFFYNRKVVQPKKFNATVNIFKTVAGKDYWIGSDKAREVVAPGTNVRLLFWKNKKIYSAYPTRSIGNNVYAYKVNRMGEMTNFDIVDTEDSTLSKIDYDHRDQTYAYLNLQEFITRNFKNRDKKISWWEKNLPLITVVICALLLGIMMWFFFAQSGKQVNQWTTISSNLNDAAKTIANAVSQSKNLGSGIVSG